MMKIYLLISFVFVAVTFAQTGTQFGDEIAQPNDEFGNSRYHRDVTINTNSVKVDHFFSKVIEHNQSTHYNIGKRGTFEVTVESNSICANDKALAQEGCSGQKPFLINRSVLNNASLKDGKGNISLAFDVAGNYSNTRDNAFFALDIARDAQYFKENSTVSSSGKKSFFDAIVQMIKNHFSPDVDYYGTNLTKDQAMIRDRYIANIVAGLDKSHQLTKKIDSKTVNTPIKNAINTPVSRLDYENLMTSVKESCKGMLLTRDPDSAYCRMVNGFSIASWMPFVNSTTKINTETSSVLADTETALLTAVGALNNTNIYNQMKSDLEGKSSFFGEMFKPMTFMFDQMMSFFFGSRPARAAIVSNHYDFTKYPKELSMTFAVTDNGAEVNDFQVFTLKGLDSVYGAEVTSCVINAPWFSGDITILGSSSNQSKSIQIGSGFMDYESQTFKEIQYSKLNFHSERSFSFLPPWYIKKTYFDSTTDELLAWCARNQPSSKKGIIGRMIDSIKDVFTKDTKEDQIDHLMDNEGFSVKSYQEKINRGLVLYLKKEDTLSTSNASTLIRLKLLRSNNP